MIPKIFKNINKKQIIIGIIILVIIILVFNGLFNKKKEEIKTEKVARATLIQEVSETGTVQSPEEVNLGFKTAGRIETINVKVGDIVEKGTPLTSLDRTQLFIQLNQAQASLAVVQTQYDKLSEDIRKAAQQDLDEAYQDALNTLDDAYLKIYNAYNAVNSLQNTYFPTSDRESIKVRYSKDMINDGLIIVKPLLDLAKTSPTNENIDGSIILTINPEYARRINSANSKMTQILSNVIDALKTVREMCEESVYASRVSSADKTIIDNQRSYIIASLANTTNAQQTIASGKIALQKAENDIDYYRAKVEEAEANVNYYQQQIWDATLRAPVKGVITKVEKKIGEMVQVTDFPISLISLDPLQIKVDIYEEDIVEVKENNPVDIKIAAFPNEILKGRIVAIDPAGKLVEGVVYYEVTIAFDEPKQDLPASATSKALQAGIKPGMTADVVIKTANKENVLVISKEAVSENGGTTVEVLKNGNIEEREVQVGLEGNDNKVEIISGLSEGEEVVIK